jgi:hypothetical protein
MLKNLMKFMVVGFVVVFLGVGALYGIQYWRERTSPEYQATEYFKELEKQYAEDPYGGETPEETLQLFIDALKKGDTELAAKYFILDKQEEWLEDLEKLGNRDLIDETLDDLNKMKLTKKTEDRAYFTLTDENNGAVSEVILYRNQKNLLWKIGQF